MSLLWVFCKFLKPNKCFALKMGYDDDYESVNQPKSS